MLRRFCEGDYEGLRTVIEDKMASEWAPYDAQWSLEDEKLRSTFAWVCGQDCWYAMEYEGEIIGFVVAQPINGGELREIGYTVRRDMQRRGFAYEACAALMREYARDAALERFTAGTAECNGPSIRLLEKLGFEKAVRHRAWFKKDENGEPMWFMGFTFLCEAEKWRE